MFEQACSDTIILAAYDLSVRGMRCTLSPKCLRDANLRDGSTQPKYVTEDQLSVAQRVSAAHTFWSFVARLEGIRELHVAPGASDLCCPTEAVSMAAPHSPALRPAADCEFLQGQKERNSSVHLVERNVLPLIQETAVQ